MLQLPRHHPQPWVWHVLPQSPPPWSSQPLWRTRSVQDLLEEELHADRWVVIQVTREETGDHRQNKNYEDEKKNQRTDCLLRKTVFEWHLDLNVTHETVHQRVRGSVSQRWLKNWKMNSSEAEARFYKHITLLIICDYYSWWIPWHRHSKTHWQQN